MGVMNIRGSERIGQVVHSVMVNDDDEVMIITQKGKIIRLSVEQVRSTGRVTQGVRMINLEAEEKVVSVAKIASEKVTAEEGEEETTDQPPISPIQQVDHEPMDGE